MPSIIRHPKDFFTGLIFVAFGLAAVVISREYSMGTAAKMGPGYFPTILGALLALIGLIAIVRSFVIKGEAIEKFALKELFIVLLSVCAFGLLIRGAGMVPAIFALIMGSSYASGKFQWKFSLLLCIGLSLFCVLLFVKVLGLSIPIFGPWFEL